MHSAILGGSNAERLMQCPASYQETLRSPLGAPSEYADEGSMLHERIAMLLRTGLPIQRFLKEYCADLDQEQRDALLMAVKKLEELKAKYAGKGRWRIVALEETFQFPGISGSFGTMDLLLANGTTVLAIDWKFGAGVPVKVVYQDTDPENPGEYLNPQIAYYLICAGAAKPRLYRDRTLVAAIIQPRMEGAELSHTETSREELAQFQEAMTVAYNESLGRDPRRQRGDWCRFAPCKSTCVLFTGPLVDLALLDPAKAALEASTVTDLTPYGDYLSKALDMSKLAELWVKEIANQAHAFLESGGRIPFYKLVPKRGTRQWVADAETIASVLRDCGATDEVLYPPPELNSVAQMEKSFKRANLGKIPDDLFQMVSSGTTVAPEEDGRIDLDRAGMVLALAEALEKV